MKVFETTCPIIHKVNAKGYFPTEQPGIYKFFMVNNTCPFDVGLKYANGKIDSVCGVGDKYPPKHPVGVTVRYMEYSRGHDQVGEVTKHCEQFIPWNEIKTVPVYTQLNSMVVGNIATVDSYEHPKEMLVFEPESDRIFEKLSQKGAQFVAFLNVSEEAPVDDDRVFYVNLMGEGIHEIKVCKIPSEDRDSPLYADKGGVLRILQKVGSGETKYPIVTEIPVNIGDLLFNKFLIIDHDRSTFVLGTSEQAVRDGFVHMRSYSEDIPKRFKDYHEIALTKAKKAHVEDIAHLKETHEHEVRTLKRDNEYLTIQVNAYKADKEYALDRITHEAAQKTIDYKVVEQEHKTRRSELSFWEGISKVLPSIAKVCIGVIIGIFGFMKWKMA